MAYSCNRIEIPGFGVQRDLTEIDRPTLSKCAILIKIGTLHCCVTCGSVPCEPVELRSSCGELPGSNESLQFSQEKCAMGFDDDGYPADCGVRKYFCKSQLRARVQVDLGLL